MIVKVCGVRDPAVADAAIDAGADWIGLMLVPKSSRWVDDAGALGIDVQTLESGARLVDCGAQARGGLQAGLGFAAACMGGLGRIDPIGVSVGERTWPGIGVAVDQPAAACLAA